MPSPVNRSSSLCPWKSFAEARATATGRRSSRCRIFSTNELNLSGLYYDLALMETSLPKR